MDTKQVFTHDHIFGWHPSIPSENDKLFKLNFFRSAAPLPVKADIFDSAPIGIWDQGQLGSCTAHGGGRSFAHIVIQQTGKQFMPARLALYALMRSLEGTLKQDAGGTVSDTVKAMIKFGVPPEEIYPYIVSKFTQLPPKSVMAVAEKYQALQAYRIADNDPNKVELIKRAIVEKHCPIFGIPIYPSFEKTPCSGSTAGVIPMPSAKEIKAGSLGGHCLCVEQFDSKLKFKGFSSVGYMQVPNSWTAQWGCKGYAIIPDEYMFRYASDIWVVTATEYGK